MIEITPTIVIGGTIALVSLTTLAVKLTDRGDSKRAKVYKRIEKSEREAEKKYMPIPLCEERAGNFTKKLDEIGRDVKTLLTKNGLK